MAALSRKHFAAIADNIKHRFEYERKSARSAIEQSIIERLHVHIARDMANYLSSTNGNFKSEKFLRACGLDYNDS